MTRPREGPDARSMSPSEAAAKKIADNTIEISRAERDHLFNTVAQQAAEIERLRGYEIAARDLSADLTKVAGDRDEQAARIKELEAELAEMHNCALEVAGFLAEKENLEAALVEERARVITSHPLTHVIDEDRTEAIMQLQAEGKIGPDATKPRSWQITEERIGLLEYCLETLLDAPDIEEIPGPGHSIEMLRAMLREAKQCE